MGMLSGEILADGLHYRIHKMWEDNVGQIKSVLPSNWIYHAVSKLPLPGLFKLAAYPQDVQTLMLLIASEKSHFIRYMLIYPCHYTATMLHHKYRALQVALVKSRDAPEG